MSEVIAAAQEPSTGVTGWLARRSAVSPPDRDVRSVRSVTLFAVAVVGLVICWSVGSPYLLTVATTVCVLALLSLGLDLIMGYTGMFSFGQAAFMGVGGYVTANLLTRTE